MQCNYCGSAYPEPVSLDVETVNQSAGACEYALRLVPGTTLSIGSPITKLRVSDWVAEELLEVLDPVDPVEPLVPVEEDPVELVDDPVLRADSADELLMLSVPEQSGLTV